MIEQEFYIEAKKKHDNGATWRQLIEDYYKEFGILITIDAIRKRVKRANNKQNMLNNPVKRKQAQEPKDFEQYNADGSIEATRTIIENLSVFKGDKSKIMNYLGYSEKEWELVSWRISQWDGGIESAPKFSIQYKIKPRKDVSEIDLLEAAKSVFSSEITPYIPEKRQLIGVHEDKLMEIPPVELHLGKIADTIQTGEEYTLEIAKKRFEYILDSIIQRQSVERCANCLIVVGNDFFNSESDNCTSVHKIPQQNSHGYIKLFMDGLQMYTVFILTLRRYFNNIDVMLCAGNHARSMETFMYIALQQYFHEDKQVNFIENYKQTQCYLFGECAIFYNHGDAKLQQIIKSIPAEFYNEWGKHKFRELHLGHLHKEVVVDDDSGMITRRIGSPCSTDAWHYQNRYVGATKKHEIFIWNKEYGLESTHYIITDKH